MRPIKLLFLKRILLSKIEEENIIIIASGIGNRKYKNMLLYMNKTIIEHMSREKSIEKPRIFSLINVRVVIDFEFKDLFNLIHL